MRRATSWVLPSWGVATVLPFSCGRGDGRGDHEGRPAGGGARDDPDGLVALRVGRDRRVGTHVGGVERSGQQRGDLGRAGVVGGGLQRDVGGRFLAKMPLLQPDQRGGMGEVGQVAEAQGDRRVRRGGTPRRLTCSSPSCSTTSCMRRPLRPGRTRARRPPAGRFGTGAVVEVIVLLVVVVDACATAGDHTDRGNQGRRVPDVPYLHSRELGRSIVETGPREVREPSGAWTSSGEFRCMRTHGVSPDRLGSWIGVLTGGRRAWGGASVPRCPRAGW